MAAIHCFFRFLFHFQNLLILMDERVLDWGKSYDLLKFLTVRSRLCNNLDISGGLGTKIPTCLLVSKNRIPDEFNVDVDPSSVSHPFSSLTILSLTHISHNLVCMCQGHHIRNKISDVEPNNRGIYDP